MGNTQSQNKLVITSGHATAVLAEYVTLCAQGRLFNDYRIESHGRDLLFRFAITGDTCAVVAASDAIDWGPEGALVALANVYLGLRLIGAKVEARGAWVSQLPDSAFVEKVITPGRMFRDTGASIVDDVCLSLADLEEIGARLFGQTTPAPDLSIDPEFRATFPGIEMKWGSYGFIRHRSGTEIRTCWSDDTHVLQSHGFEAPRPAEPLARKWLKTKGVEPETNEFLKYRQKKWRLAKLLNRVPQPYKQRVYEWVITTHFDVEEFHSTRGGYPIPELFECTFGKSTIFCERDLEFAICES